jgi:serine phosphatase RsbU (regulator of sigma subunit)
MAHSYDKVLAFFIPQHTAHSGDDYRSSKLLVNACFVTIIFSLLYFLISLYIEFEAGQESMFINVVAFIGILFLYRADVSHLICSNIFVGTGALGIYNVTYFSGGIHSPVLPWNVCIPIMIILLTGKKSGLVWSFITIAAISFFGFAELNGYKFPITYQPDHAKWFTISTHAGLVLIVFVIALVFESDKTKALFKLKNQTMEATLQKEELQQKNKNITDSINYAKRIQYALLLPDEKVKQLLPESFILYRPKDIVSGDFYWIDFAVERTLIVAADCTGHGVPGALLSVVGHNMLNQLVNEYALTDPATILNQLNKGFIKLINQSKSNEIAMRDGMEVGVCSLDSRKGVLFYSGANVPLWYMRGNELHEIKGDKQPIGATGEMINPYHKHTIKTEPGDIFYLMSDGYGDQFGGDDGKKFKRQRIRNLIRSIYQFPMEKQKQLFEQTIEDWRGAYEQVDDIMVIAFKI